VNDKASLCRICAKPIPVGARKCTECDEYQNYVWRIASGFDLRGLIALVPIVALAFAFIQDRVEKKESNLRVALVSCEPKKVNLFASNVGTRAAIISDASFQTNDLPAQPMTVSLSSDKRLIDGGETRAIELSVNPQLSPGGLVPYEERGKQTCSVSITVNTIAFDHKPDPHVMVCDCPN
jgi:hypothetical protein